MKIRNLVFGAICGIIFFSCSESGGGKEVEMDRFVTDLMGKMTIREKLGQLNLPSGGDLVTGSVMNSELSDMIRKEEIGGFFNVKGIKKIYDLQRLAVEETRLKIPLIVGADVIHGYETIFPIPLALSCSWDTLAIQRMARISAIEASADGICWAFSPMVAGMPVGDVLPKEAVRTLIWVHCWQRPMCTVIKVTVCREKMKSFLV